MQSNSEVFKKEFFCQFPTGLVQEKAQFRYLDRTDWAALVEESVQFRYLGFEAI